MWAVSFLFLMVLCEGQTRIPTGHTAISTRATKTTQRLQWSLVPSPQTQPRPPPQPQPQPTHKHKAHSPPPLTFTRVSLRAFSDMWPCGCFPCNRSQVADFLTSEAVSHNATLAEVMFSQWHSTGWHNVTKPSQGRASPPRTSLVRNAWINERVTLQETGREREREREKERERERETEKDFSQLVFHAYLQLRGIMSTMLTERVN